MNSHTALPAEARGFTLIEMLVVIAVIGVLAAMLSGPLMQARASGQNISCKNLVKQYGTATTMYVNDCSDWLPDAAVYLDKEQSSFCSYFGSSTFVKDIVRCPGDASTAGLGRLYRYHPGKDDELEISIGANASVLSSSINPTASGNAVMFRKITHSAFNKASKVISWTDYQHNSSGNYNGAFITATKGHATNPAQTDTLGNVVFRHNSAANAAFLDGHVGNVSFNVPDDLADNGHNLKSGAAWAGTGNLSYPYGPRPENLKMLTSLSQISENVSVTYK